MSDEDSADIPVAQVTGANTWLTSAVMAAIVSLQDSGVDADPIFERARRDKMVSVRLTIEGHDVPASFFFDRFGEHFDAAVGVRARELVRERMDEQLAPIRDALDGIAQGTDELAREHFPSWCSEGEG